MPIRIITVPFLADKDIFDDEELNRFLENKKVISTQAHFFTQENKSFWTVFIEFETLLVNSVSPFAMAEPERMLYENLAQWRREQAGKDGVPVFIVATNSELAEVVRRAPKSIEALKSIKGFGNKKLEKYGKAILNKVNGFYERKIEDRTIKT